MVSFSVSFQSFTRWIAFQFVINPEVTFLSILSSDILTIVTKSESETSNHVAIGLTNVHEF